MNDRALQDELIRYLTDADQRRQGPGLLPIAAPEARKATRFSHFLARHYYRDRLARSFQYSRQFRQITSRRAEEVVDSPPFDSFLESCVLGSLAAAQQVGGSARAYLSETYRAPWWTELLQYEYAYFLQAATLEQSEQHDRLAPRTSACLEQFSWDLPELLKTLREGTTPGDDLRRDVTLLFSRTDTGKIYVVEVEMAVAKVFRATDGRRTRKQIAEAAGMAADETHRVLEALGSIGAVRF
jgi:hypothetical protein